MTNGSCNGHAPEIAVIVPYIDDLITPFTSSPAMSFLQAGLVLGHSYWLIRLGSVRARAPRDWRRPTVTVASSGSGLRKQVLLIISRSQ